MTPSSALSWLRANWREALGVALAFFAIGWAAHHQKPRIEYRDRVVTKTEWKDRIVEKTVTVAAKEEQKERVTHRHEVIAPDGTHTIDLDTGTGVQTQVNVGQFAAVSITEQGTQAATRETQVVQTPAPLPRWRVGALAGLSTGGVSYGAEASCRVLGPLWLGVGGFVGPHPMGFATIGVEW
jgi:hypothetical protein